MLFTFPNEERTLRNPWVKSFSCIKMTSRGDELKAQLETLRYFPESTIDNVKELVELVQSLSATTKTFVPQVIVLEKILLVIQWEIIFCHEAGKSVPPFYHFWLPTEPFDGPSCPQDRTDSLNLVEVKNVFVERNDSRQPIFDVFGEKDVAPKQGTKRAATQTHFKH